MSLTEGADKPKSTMRIPITKAKTFIEIDIEALPDAVYKAALAEGLKVLANRGTTKITKDNYTKNGQVDEPAMQAKALEIANEQVKAMLNGTIKLPGAKVEKVSGAVNTEAMRLARAVVKEAIKREGGKVSTYKAKEITDAAKVVLAENPSLLEQAKENLERASKPGIKVHLDESKLAQSKAEKAATTRKRSEAGKQLSAAQAGKTAKRPPAKGKPAPAQHAQH